MMRENPVRGFEAPKEKNPMRPVATEDRYEAVRGVSDQVVMDLPDVDVAEPGGWKTLETLKTAYQQADPETMLLVVLEPKKLREVR